jgi:Fe-S cluster biosynthesis and repair protein YggX
LTDTSNYSGSNNDTLLINNANLGQNNTDYRCIISNNGCVDTSIVGTLLVTDITSLNHINLKHNFDIYYNTVEDVLNFEIDDLPKNTIIEIYNALGQQMMTKRITHQQTKINLESLSIGCYSVIIFVDHEADAIKKFVKLN